MVGPAGPMDKDDAVQVAQYLGPKMAAPVGFDVWTREESGLVRTDRDVCTHCDDALELARQLASMHVAMSVTSYDLDKHASRAAEASITLAPTTIVRGSGRSIQVCGLFSGLLFPALLDVISYVSQGRSPLPDEMRAVLAGLPEVEIEVMVASYDPYSGHMVRLLGAFAMEAKAMRLKLTQLAEFPVLAGQRSATEIPIVTINGRRFSGAWDEESLLQQIRYVIEGSSEIAVRERVLAVPFLTEEQAIQQAQADLEREQAAAGGLVPGTAAPGPDSGGGRGLIVPGG